MDARELIVIGAGGHAKVVIATARAAGFSVVGVFDDRTDIKTVEFGWPVGLPVCRSLGDGLWEVRSSLRNRIARVLFCVADDTMWLLHGFIKKRQKTPPEDLALARRRMREVLEVLRHEGE